MSKIKTLIRRIATLGSTCPSGHKSVIMLPGGRQQCLDRGATW
ncbi:hypothetical protein ACGFYV_30050 [Streptomyces sp. NPDC048297]